ncbi:MAG: pirin family protein, partial [Marivirga sp.]|nr:pirin family protein [Marivirga sp.]
ATFSYVFEGSLSHFDSRGNRGVINAGGLQWMKAGNGIIHDEQPFSSNVNEKVLHSLQFWINLPSAVKAEAPEYMAVRSEHVPKITLPNNAGILCLLLGEFGSLKSSVKTFTNEFIYHFKLNPKSQFCFSSKHELEYGVFVPTIEVAVNQVVLSNSKIAKFESGDQQISLENPNIQPADVLIFGGLHYNEAIVAEGPFVMNSRVEIAEAYRDFFDGKYGEINYTKG